MIALRLIQFRDLERVSKRLTESPRMQSTLREVTGLDRERVEVFLQIECEKVERKMREEGGELTVAVTHPM
jgi:hypothetical protein